MVKISVKLLSVLATATSLVRGAHIYSCTEKNVIALTFDDGPTQYTSKLLDALSKYGIKATFFVNAHNYTPYADENKSQQKLIKRAYEAGHQIASHTYNHNLPMDSSEMKQSLRKMDSFIKSIIGVTPRYFRAPGGNCGESCVKNLENLGYRVIKWDVDTEDWRNGSDGAISTMKDFFKQGNENYLVLMHDSVKSTVENTLPWIANSGISKKYKFVTVAECLGDKSKMYRESSSSSSSSGNNSSNSSNKTTTTKIYTKTTTIVANAAATAATTPEVIAPIDPTTSTLPVNGTTIIPEGNADVVSNLNNGNVDPNTANRGVYEVVDDKSSNAFRLIEQSLAMLMITVIFVLFTHY